MLLKSQTIFLFISSLMMLACESPNEHNQADLDGLSEDQLCALATTHIETCAGGLLAPPSLACNGDADLLLETPCEVIAQAAALEQSGKADSGWGNDVPFHCKWFGIGCPVDDDCYPILSDDSRQQLLYLTDVNTLVDEYDARFRVAKIAEIFEAEPDPIGMFAIVYRQITNNAVWSVEEGLYENGEWTRVLITNFARRYLENLHGHLIGGQVTPQWRKYYKLARNCQVGRGRVLGVAIATHLMVDLPKALHDSYARPEHEEDFMLFGEISLWVFPNLVEDTYAVYNTDVTDLLKGFFFGDWIDSVKGTGTATNFIYQTVRRNAWRNSQNFLDFPYWIVNADIAHIWGLAEFSLASLDAAGVL